MRYESFKREVFNLPNMITIGRLLMIPPVLWLIHPHEPARNLWAALLFAAASGLDILDGWLARSRGLVTVFGKFVDPLADKIMAMAVLVYLVYVGLVPPWLVVVLLGREFYISGLRTVASAEGVIIAAGDGGKVKTIFQLVGICCVLARYRYRLPGMEELLDLHRIGLTFIYISMVVSLISAVQYTTGFRQALKDLQSEE